MMRAVNGPQNSGEIVVSDHESSSPEFQQKKAGESKLRAFLSRWGRWILLLLGIIAVFLLIQSVGWAELSGILWAAGPWLPLILLLDIGWVGLESFAVLLLYGKPARRIPPRAWVEATLIHYTTMTVLPVGRTGAEVARAGLMAPWVGASRAATGALVMQTLTLTVNTMISFCCLIAVVAAVGNDKLSWLLFGNGVATFVLGGGLYLVMSRVKIGGLIGKKFESMAERGPEFDECFQESRPRHLPALFLAFGARTLQTVQYGVILLAVVGSFEISGTLIAQGIHLVGAGLGDMIPNQVGVTEGAYRLFAGALGLAAQPEKAVAIALLARISNLGVAGLCALGAQLIPRAQPETTAESL